MNGKPVELHIEPIKSQKHYEFSKSIPHHPSRLLLIDSSQLPHCFINMLRKRFPYLKFYSPEKIYVIVHTVNMDKRWDKLGLKKENFSDKWDADWINMVVGKVNDKKVPFLAIFDDIVPIHGEQKKNQPFWELYIKGRWQGRKMWDFHMVFHAPRISIQSWETIVVIYVYGYQVTNKWRQFMMNIRRGYIKINVWVYISMRLRTTLVHAYQLHESWHKLWPILQEVLCNSSFIW